LPNEVAGLITWVRRQPWIDPDRVSLTGVSLCAVALPVIQWDATNAGDQSSSSIITYRGIDIHALARADLKYS
jgi:hypothetical protein